MTGKINIEKRLSQAVQSYWSARAKNKAKQVESGRLDAGSRNEVTGGTQMGALELLVADILCETGLKRLDVRTRTALELPGYFRATKKWDLIVVSESQLVLAMEFKSQAGQSIGNNVNNRSEEALRFAVNLSRQRQVRSSSTAASAMHSVMSCCAEGSSWKGCTARRAS